MTDFYDQLVNAIIRPPRGNYDIRELGPKSFNLSGSRCKRTDFEVVNKRGLTLQCSRYVPLVRRKKMPVVIYCHGNCGSRIDALHSVRILLPMGISVVSFDCAGSGNSDGEVSYI
eukprot:TRINITY_DN1457_c0_g1_i3.p1 TRINITY_DN1457_c0_g1~~TRINITY_DN1457_c0_g1_i3.p1  ORF type:complete len:127 (-),score=10.16 TRINITY_DN1457_c0_g1_i3:43-387(-)